VVDEAVSEEPRTGPAVRLGERIFGWLDMVSMGRGTLTSMGSYFGGLEFRPKLDTIVGAVKTGLPNEFAFGVDQASAKEKRRLGSSRSEAHDEWREGKSCQPVSILH